jgi:hypothetical protein
MTLSWVANVICVDNIWVPGVTKLMGMEVLAGVMQLRRCARLATSALTGRKEPG